MVIAINERECALTAENSTLLDRAGLEAAVELPWSGFGEFEAFPSLYDKAAALLHGIAARQVFENGNKRTAWLAAVALLDINGVDLGLIAPSWSRPRSRGSATSRPKRWSERQRWITPLAWRESQSGFA